MSNAQQATNFDYGDDGKPQIGHNSMAMLEHLAREQLQAERLLAEAEDLVELRKKQLAEIAEGRLPKIMKELKLKDFTTQAGTKIELADIVRCGIPAKDIEAQEKAFQYLIDDDNAGMIKRQITIEFARDEESWAKKFLADLAKRKKPVRSKVKKWVEPSTLKAYVSKALKAGKDIPKDLFQVFTQDVTVVKIKE